MRACGRRARPILLTDGLFSHDGSVAPLAAYRKILPASGLILVDDAHGAGVLGRTGQGTLEYLGLQRARIVQTVTLSKAFGVYGGAILGPAELRRKIIARSSAFVSNTPLPLPLASAALEAIAEVERNHTPRERLSWHAHRVKAALAEFGCVLPSTPVPIIPVVPASSREAATLAQRLLKARIHPPLIKYPGGPRNGYFRFVISSEHTEAQVDALLRILLEHLRPPTRPRRPAKA
jgi:7-keto-8-aminopelargonate synthetase-like enzyme